MHTPQQLGLTLRLAWREYLHEWVMSGCYVLALAALLVPLLVLFGLKHGVISSLLEPLREDPRYREIGPRGSAELGPEWFASMRARDDVAFVVPSTRAIAASIKLRAPHGASGNIIDVELIPSGPGDPALGPDVPAPHGYAEVVLSSSAAAKLGVASGARLEGIVARTRDGVHESERLPLEAIGVAPAGAFARDGVFASVALLAAVEDYRDGRAVPALGWPGAAPRDEARAFAGFRLFARGIDDVATLRADLLAQGLDVRTRAADIELVEQLDRNLTVIYWIIAAIAATGYCFSFGTSVWANVDRKRQEFSVLRLVGLRSAGIVGFPIAQALLTAVLGWALAGAVFFAVQGVLNALFTPELGLGREVCRLLPRHLAVTLAATLAVAAVPASIAGLRLARIEPSLGLRDA